MVNTLVVEDDAGVLDLVASLLSGAGHDVTTVTDGLQAFELLTDESFDLCVLDHELPGMNGLNIAGALLAQGSRTRFLLISGSARIDFTGLAQREHFMSKPFEPDQLLKLVEELMHS